MLSRQAIERAAAVLARGEAVILPTDTVPGLFIKDTPEAQERLRVIKGRGEEKPFARMFGSRKQIQDRALIKTRMQKLALERLLPGRVTLILSEKGNRERKVGVRLPMDSSLRVLIRSTGPLIATSANLSGEQLRDPAALPPELLERVALVEEDSLLQEDSPNSARIPVMASTVIDLTTRRPMILRKGAVSVWTVGRRLGRTPYLPPPQELNLLFVCGGNTCRSPMAAALFSAHCACSRINAGSAGLSARQGAQAAWFAQKVMGEHGVSITTHRSREVADRLLAWADLVLVMTRSHLLRIRREYTRFADRTFLLTGFPAPWPHGRNIDDPIGGSLKIYRSTSRQIQLYTASICAETEKVLSRAS